MEHDKYKNEKNAFKAWRSRNKESEISIGYTKALEMQDPAKREAEMTKLMSSWSGAHSRNARGVLTFSHESRTTSTKRTTNQDLDYVSCCTIFHLKPEALETTSILDSFVKLGSLKKSPLKGKALETAKLVDLGGDGRLFSYKRVTVDQVKDVAEEDKATKAVEEKTKSEEGMQDRKRHLT